MNMKELLTIVENDIGYKLPEDKRHSIARLEDIPKSLLSDARKLNTPLLAEIFLGFFLTSECTTFLKIFVQDQVFNAMSSAGKKYDSR